ncbi:FAD/NAD(P)-binding domain-containing protein [Penicillium chermesinum]|nr:FAD/NAD(P)-binding domain-containing protein [Penicillium chermesinum]
MTTITRKPILISGAGLASLLLGQALRRASIPFLIFERDSSISFRAQGYRLRLSVEGLDAIESVLAPEDWKTFWDTCGKTGGAGFSSIDAITGEQHPELTADNNKTPPIPKEVLKSRGDKIVGISRGDMRRLFMTGCEPYIKWAHRVTGYELLPDGVRAIFADGSKSEEGEMLIAGEGIYSKVAKQLSQGKLKVYDTGARGIHGQAPAPAFKELGEGVWRMTDDTKPGGRVFTITNPGVINVPGDDFSIIGSSAANIAKSLTTNWHPRLKPLFEQMNVSEAAFWKITCSTPTGVPEWTNEPRVTVIGDAAHSMTPAGGIGANTAVRDSALLGRLLTEAGGYRSDITANYEKQMRIYASEAAGKSYSMAEAQFGIKIDKNSPTV